jgi:site-specific DNA-methyltransferase (adenine-specific)
MKEGIILMLELNKLYCTNNLELMNKIESESINMIYSDILYGTGKNFGDYQDIKADKNIVFDFYTKRIKEMHRILKPNGVIVLQCDYRINHWIRNILDDVFGYKNFVNEIVWWYKKFSQNNDKTYLTNHDYLIVYTKGENYTFNTQYIINEDKDKRMKKGYFNCGGGKYLVYDFDKFNKFAEDKNIAKENIKDKTNDTPYTRVDDVFRDIMFINSQSKERVGYETQKPKDLVGRIIKTFTNEGDIVADFFCGSGTSLVVAKELGRQYIGCDINPKAIEITQNRLNKIS